MSKKTKYEIVENIRRLRALQLIELENLEKSMILEDMFPDKSFPIKMQVTGRSYNEASAIFEFADKTKQKLSLIEVSKKLWPEELIDQWNKYKNRQKVKLRLEHLKKVGVNNE